MQLGYTYTYVHIHYSTYVRKDTNIRKTTLDTVFKLPDSGK